MHMKLEETFKKHFMMTLNEDKAKTTNTLRKAKSACCFAC